MKSIIIRKPHYRTPQARVTRKQFIETTKQLGAYVGRPVLVANEKEQRT